jgi:molybdopterin/thiamine biosynthesis adenylyltransferase
MPPSDRPSLSPQELERYARQLLPGALTQEAQERLQRAAVLVTRAGGMGGPAALALAMAGVGKIIIAHSGALQSPDLNRQALGSESGLGAPRAAQFAARLRAINRFIDIDPIDHEPDDDEAAALARRVDVIIASPPNFSERMRLNQAAVAAGVPLVDAAQWGMTGTLLVVQPGETACLRCLYPADPPFEEHFPVLGAISSAIGSLAALEAIKLISGVGRPLAGRMLLIDSFQGITQQLELHRNANCPVCGARGVAPSHQASPQ